LQYNKFNLGSRSIVMRLSITYAMMNRMKPSYNLIANKLVSECLLICSPIEKRNGIARLMILCYCCSKESKVHAEKQKEDQIGQFPFATQEYIYGYCSGRFRYACLVCSFVHGQPHIYKSWLCWILMPLCLPAYN
jgi:hypothetical protein